MSVHLEFNDSPDLGIIFEDDVDAIRRVIPNKKGHRYLSESMRLWSQFRSKEYRKFIEQEKIALDTGYLRYPLGYNYFNKKCSTYWRKLDDVDKKYNAENNIDLNWIIDI